MGIFDKREKQAACGCAGGPSREAAPASGSARVQVMGTGCKKCHALYESAVEALGEGEVEYVTDMARIAEAGVMTLPALVVDGKVACAGRVPSASEVRELAGRA